MIISFRIRAFSLQLVSSCFLLFIFIIIIFRLVCLSLIFLLVLQISFAQRSRNQNVCAYYYTDCFNFCYNKLSFLNVLHSSFFFVIYVRILFTYIQFTLEKRGTGGSYLASPIFLFDISLYFFSHFFFNLSFLISSSILWYTRLLSPSPFPYFPLSCFFTFSYLVRFLITIL